MALPARQTERDAHEMLPLFLKDAARLAGLTGNWSINNTILHHHYPGHRSHRGKLPKVIRH